VLDQPSSSLPRLTRRHLLRTGAGALAGGTLAGRLITGGAWASTPTLAAAHQASVSEALRVLGRSALRHPDSVPAAGLGTGTDTMPAIEHKWNLPSMTYRDANANNLTDFRDMSAMAAGQPTFPELPALAGSGENASTLACERTGPGQIPPLDSGSGSTPGTPHKLPRIRIELRDLGLRRRLRGLLLELRTSHGSLHGLTIELHHGERRVASHTLSRLAHAERRIVFRIHGHAPERGRYTVVVRHGRWTLLRRVIHVR
jgi:hypothetical protein